MTGKESYSENEYAEFWIEEGLLVERFKPHLKEIKFAAAKMIVEQRLLVSNEVDRPMLVIVENTISIDKEARDYFNSPPAQLYVLACGFVIQNYIAWLAAKLFVSMDRPAFNVDFFRSKNKAVEWLEQFK